MRHFEPPSETSASICRMIEQHPRVARIAEQLDESGAGRRLAPFVVERPSAGATERQHDQANGQRFAQQRLDPHGVSYPVTIRNGSILTAVYIQWGMVDGSLLLYA